MFLIRWILKITGLIPALLLFHPRKIFLGSLKSTVRFKGPAVISMNHTGFLDYIAALSMFPFRRMDVLVSEAMYQYSPVLRFMLKAMGVVKVASLTGNMESVNEAVNKLKKGHLILIFPEGRIETTKELFPYQMGAALIALSADVPIVPMYIEGKYGLGKRRNCFVAEPMYPKDIVPEGTGLKDSAAMITEDLYQKTQEIHDYYFQYYYTSAEKKPKRPSYAGAAYLFVKYTAIPLLKLFMNPRIICENERAALALHQEKRMVIISNHSWWMDLPLVHYAFRHRRPRSLAARDVAELNRFQRIMQEVMGCIFIDRFHYDWGTIKLCMDELNAEHCISVCPEGKLNFEDEISPFHKGAAMLALTTGTPVVTVYLNCSYKPFHRAVIMIGEPVMAGQSTNTAEIEAFNHVLEEKMKSVKEMAQKQTSPKEQQVIEQQKQVNREKVRNFGGQGNDQ